GQQGVVGGAGGARGRARALGVGGSRGRAPNGSVPRQPVRRRGRRRRAPCGADAARGRAPRADAQAAASDPRARHLPVGGHLPRGGGLARARRLPARGRLSARRRRSVSYPQIEHQAVSGDLHTAALVALDGTIDWLCLPRFDSPSLFASLLDDKRGGYFRIAATSPDARRRQMYLPDSNVLMTRFLTPD